MFENKNYAFAGAFVDELARSGLQHVCICPGSRSSPLTISFARHTGIKTWLHLDERSASYFALGMARALREPVALVCTSGTAAANFYPAVAEAHNNGVPLIILTADRPLGLADWGALQTIDQTRMYGSHAKWSVNAPLPEATTGQLAYVRSLASRAFATSKETPFGPVHINFPFQEPLEPVDAPEDFLRGIPTPDDTAWRGRSSGIPYVQSPSIEKRLPREELGRLGADLSSSARGIIVCGPQDDRDLPRAVVTLAEKLGYPILADVLSQVRCGPHDRSLVLDCYDAFIRDSELVESLRPDVVLRFGAAPVSKPVAQYLERHKDARHILVDDGTGWRDPFYLTSEVLHVDPVLFCYELAKMVDGRLAGTEWASRWCSTNQAAKEAVGSQLDQYEELFEGRVPADLAGLLPDGAIVFAGNSMPVRDLDTFYPTTEHAISFFANRGASGIDGVVSTALGVAAASRRRVVLVIGDISFYHDMNGLLAAKAHGLDATIIVINNDGGGIFSFLPQASYPDVFETYFGTRHGLTFRSTAELYGLAYTRLEEWRQFKEVVTESLARPGATIIEVPSDRARNVELHRKVWQAVAEKVRAMAGGVS